MKQAKRDRLTAAGWRIGDSKEFLGLSDEEASLIELRLALARLLRERRSEQQVTQTEVAKLIQSSQSRVAKMEAGDSSVSADLLMRTLFALGVSFGELGALVATLGPKRRSRRPDAKSAKRSVAGRKQTKRPAVSRK